MKPFTSLESMLGQDRFIWWMQMAEKLRRFIAHRQKKSLWLNSFAMRRERLRKNSYPAA
jgi:hypothetical protein